ncbi:MAG: type II secretion system secretin GspD [Rhizobiaceae bacterium]|jgi:general secretion pathway protein D|nr:type II secretion system secretin GspD [Rhizobiaceae bacterium]
MAAVAACLFLSACQTSSFFDETKRSILSKDDPLSGVTSADLSARQPSGGGFLSSPGGGDNRQAVVYAGQEFRANYSRAEQTSLKRLNGQTFELNLDNADVPTAARAVLGNVLNLGYTIDGRVQGAVTLNTGGPIPADELLIMFESALRSNNIAMLREGTRLRLIPAEEAMGAAQIDRGVEVTPGYGVTLYPLKFVSAATIIPLIDSFVARPGMVREEPGANSLIIQGTAEERRSALVAIQSFDQDWLASESVGIFPVSSTSAASLIPELNRVLDLNAGGRGAGTIKVQAVERSNAILVVAKTRNQLQRAAQWIGRLDRLDPQASNLRVYRVQHVDPERLAAMVNSIFNGGSPAQVTEDPNAQLPPEAQGASTQQGNEASSDLNNAMNERFGQSDMQGGAPSPGLLPDPNAAQPSASGPGAGGVRITANKENNSILIYARPDQQKAIEQAIIALDRPQDQVAIEATIAEVVLSNELKYGVQFFLKSQDLGLGDDDGSVGLFGGAANAAINRVLPGFNLLIGAEDDPRLILDALRGVTEVKILSSPSVVVTDNKPAKLQVGDEVPIVTRTSQSVTDPEAPIVNNVEYKNTGVILNVLPRITANGTINLQVQQEISSVARTNGGSTLTPTVSQRRISSTVQVQSGQTVMLGGLISERQERGRDGIPILGDIPILGEAFRSNRNAGTRTELIVLIRPQVIRDGADAQAVAEAMRAQLRLMNAGGQRVPLKRPVPTIIE